jgi:hypothetical protein
MRRAVDAQGAQGGGRVKIIECHQGSPEWHGARCGRATASEFSGVLAKGEGKTRAAYLRKLVGERLTGKVTESFSNVHTLRGSEHEAMARLSYEASIDDFVEQVGFLQHDTLMVGCSPDGLVGSKGGCEFKCVLPHIHVETMLRGNFPPEHKAQVQGCLWISGREFWDFGSYCPEMPAHLRLYRHRVTRDEAYIENLEAEVRKFLAEVDRTVELLLGAQAKKVA